MNQSKVQTASKLLAKAESTTSDHEAVALVERAYSLLALVITEYDDAMAAGPGGARRRERRRMQDRRRRARQEKAAAAPPARAVDSLDR
ncbi:MAG TPA: DUF2786 domain-containing protein, partial [Acidimicrobiales bacterium]|nr:DUF2786 domain-containing protein [Acidimicrobiales bacterium]